MKKSALTTATALGLICAATLAITEGTSNKKQLPEETPKAPDLTVEGYLSAFYFSYSDLNAKDLIKSEASESCLDVYKIDTAKSKDPKTCAFVFNTLTHPDQGTTLVPELGGVATVSCTTSKVLSTKKCETVALKLNR